MGVGWPFIRSLRRQPNLVEPDTLPTRLQAAGLGPGEVQRGGRVVPLARGYSTAVRRRR